MCCKNWKLADTCVCMWCNLINMAFIMLHSTFLKYACSFPVDVYSLPSSIIAFDGTFISEGMRLCFFIHPENHINAEENTWLEVHFTDSHLVCIIIPTDLDWNIPFYLWASVPNKHHRVFSLNIKPSLTKTITQSIVLRSGVSWGGGGGGGSTVISLELHWRSLSSCCFLELKRLNGLSWPGISLKCCT